MADTIKLKRGLDIKLIGLAEKRVIPLNARKYALKPTDFVALRYPKVLVNEGDEVKIGTVLCYDKYRERIQFTSPVSGKITGIKRGPKRILEEFQIESDEKDTHVDFGAANPADLSREEIIQKMLDSGIWPMLRQRPYSVIANPEDKPKAIFISGFESAPLAPDMNFIVEGKEREFQAGIDVLTQLTEGKVHLSLKAGDKPSKVFTGASNVDLHYFQGPHPASNVGVQIHHIEPINKGDIVWYTYPQEVITIGRLFLEGKYNPEKIVALTGSEVLKPQYYKTRIGVSIENMVKDNVKEGQLRYISGNVLTGTKIRKDGYLSFYHNQITVIPEGNYYEFFGWAKPGLNKFSNSRSFLSWWFKPNKRYRLDTNMHGGERAYVMSGEYDKVIPMDILPVQLVKSIIIEDIDLMENLGIYEVDEEDFALAEVICTSKINVQSIIRKGLNLMRAEMS
ncbi:MAG: Na(+)-translocating NADH-quinone reductase subunit A [Bacteroidales bacterium]|nr:Na(+)-translocating NADH-quinone reductase subunit A [Bacteroidales bacterium]MCF8338676.1 Na(+)-translocating NADH-quinone reductase subunit A [Bacteroidales bacterium]